MKRSYCLLVLFGWICSYVLGAESYATARLKAMTSFLSLPGIDTLSAGQYTHFVYKSHPLNVRINQYSEVEHIGLKLFEEEMKAKESLPIYDFLERYLLERNLIKGMEEEIRLGFDDVIFLKGEVSDALRLDGTETFTMTYQPFREYKVEWSKDGETFLIISFGMDYQLISGCDIIELEKNYFKKMTRYCSDSDTVSSSSLYSSISFPRTDSFYVQKGSMFMMASIRNDLYFQKKKNEWKLLNDPSKPYQSIANSVLARSSEKNYELEVTLDMYGYKEAKDTIQWNDWLAFCEQEGCIPYFGMKNKTDSSYTGTVFMVNETCGFVHMLSIVFPVTTLEKGKGIIKGRLFVYIPFQNIKDQLLYNAINYKTTNDEN